MAEYIDRDKVLNYRETIITDDYSGNETLEVVLAEEILGLTPADVIEREKIDKAIKIAKDSISACFKLGLNERAFGMREILNIFEENIGESK